MSNMNKILSLVSIGMLMTSLSGGIEIIDDQRIGVDGKTFSVPPLKTLSVQNETHGYFPVFDANKQWFASGTSPKQSIFNSIKSIRVFDASGSELAEGKDFVFSSEKNRIGLLNSGAKAQLPVSLCYTYVPQRIDSIIRNARGELSYRTGVAAGITPRMAELQPGETRLVNIHLSAGQQKVSGDNVYPITETAFPENNPPCAEQLLPKTTAKLRAGVPVKILAWGDSVTEGYGDLDESDRWQEQFVRRLKERFPKADIELITNGWGGHNTTNFFAAPESDSKHHYPDSIIGVKPDLVISEFVNDSWHDQNEFNRIYPKLLNDFRAAGIEWIVITPHHIMDMKNIDGNDSRLYVKLLRQFAKDNNIALADVSDRYSRLYRQGIPYLTLMVNHFNHPDARGMKIYSDALIAVFPPQ